MLRRHWHAEESDNFLRCIVTTDNLCTIHKVPRNQWARCHRCHGHGTVIEPDEDDYIGVAAETQCPDCGGHGGTEECEFCLEEDQLL